MMRITQSPVYLDYSRFKRTALDRCGKLGPHYRHTVCEEWRKPSVVLDHFRANLNPGYEPQLTPGQTEFGPGTTLFLPRGFVSKYLNHKLRNGFSRDSKGIKAEFERGGVRLRKRFLSEIEACNWYKLQREKLVHDFANNPKSKLNCQTKAYLLTWRFEPPKC